MATAYIFAVLVFSTVLCIIEIPKMLREKLYKEFWTFSILLGLGVVLVILLSFDIKIPNPSDWVAWVYSPLKEIIENISK